MDQTTMNALIWGGAIVLLVLYVARRKKRKLMH
jgi:LPXTG-motif cell wall-anchored protein